MLVGDVIRQARKLKGFSSMDLARKMNTSQSAISFIETNKRVPNNKTLKKISECLEVDYSSLLTCKKETVLSQCETRAIDLMKAHKINTLIINSKIKGRCFLCGNELKLKGFKEDDYILSCECGLKLYIPLEEIDDK